MPSSKDRRMTFGVNFLQYVLRILIYALKFSTYDVQGGTLVAVLVAAAVK